MKTILVTFGTSEGKFAKRYAFNTSDELVVGDEITSSNYSSILHVVKVLEESYKYFNRVTGELSNTFNNSNQFEIKELKLRVDEAEIVYATKVN